MSFFYQLNPLSAVAEPLQFITPGQPLGAVLSNGQLVLHLQQACDGLTAVTDIAEDTAFTAVASVRIFGQAISWQLVQQVLAVTGAEQWARIQVIKPHSQLEPALNILLPVIPDAGQQAALKQLARQLPETEVVLLTPAPSLALPGLLVMDMDSTAIRIECIDEIATLAGVGEKVAAVTARAMNGELDFVQSLTERVAALAGASEDILQQVLQTIPLMPGLTELVAYLQQHQWQVAIASGGFTYFTEALRTRFKLTAAFANQLDIVDGKLTGKVRGNIVDAARKAEVVTELARQYQIASGQTVAIGDGANDLPMLQTAALGVAFHAKPKVQEAATASIRQGSLLQLLYLLDS
ncbi:phosphoserine phosphatase SerB [Chromatiaceae bacterium AAb-1]|nr:phosphoserine phosphatase SerB [Chromatiaceae bacterium AAb-1]